MVTARTPACFVREHASISAIVLVFIFLFTGSAGATIIDVPGDQPTIQAGINAAGPGDSVLVAPGIYTGPSNKNLNFAGVDRVLLSAGGPTVTIIDCQGSGRGIEIIGDETIACRIEGFMIRNGFVDSEGGGALINGAGATFVNCIFRTNHGDSGGGIWCNQSALVVTDCIFVENLGEGNSSYSGYGGGLWVDRISQATVTDSHFERNHSKRGAGVWVGGSANVEIADCTFIENEAQSRGGGIGASGAPTSLRVLRSTFTRNSAVSIGGGAALLDLNPEFTDCRFLDNTSLSRGGGMFLGNSDAIVTSSLFAGNTAEESGGGVDAIESSPTIRSVTFHGNSAPLGGGLAAGLLGSPSAVTIERSIIAFGTLGEAVYCEMGSTADLSCTDVFGNVGGDWVGCIGSQLGGDGNIALDPLFCNATADDFRIEADSPCAPDNSPPGCNLIGAFPAGCGVGVPSTEAPAAQLRLQVVPNPIVTGGKIEWTSASQAPMSLHLYDAAGRLVATRDLGTVIAGRHQLAWEEAFEGKRLGSGVYFLRWESGTTVAPAVRVVVTH